MMDTSRNCKVIKLNILQWNSQSLRPKAVALENYLLREKVHICITYI